MGALIFLVPEDIVDVRPRLVSPFLSEHLPQAELTTRRSLHLLERSGVLHYNRKTSFAAVTIFRRSDRDCFLCSRGRRGKGEDEGEVAYTVADDDRHEAETVLITWCIHCPSPMVDSRSRHT
jgi:hypothetical protein